MEFTVKNPLTAEKFKFKPKYLSPKQKNNIEGSWLIIFGGLIVLSQGTAVAPFIYTIF